MLNSVFQIITFFEKISCAAPGRSFMYNLSGNLLNKVVYNYWLKMQVVLSLHLEWNGLI